MYPKGAIRKSAEILNVPYGTVAYEASRRHSQGNPGEVILTGETGTRWSKGYDEKIGAYDYLCYISVDIPSRHERSLVDLNIDAINGYNDWFLFLNREDAEAYLSGDDD